MTAPRDYHSEIARLDALSRTRALTMAESTQLERCEEAVRYGRGMKTGTPNRLIGQGTSQPAPSDHTIEAGDRLRRRDAEEANLFFMVALNEYFKRGGKA